MRRVEVVRLTDEERAAAEWDDQELLLLAERWQNNEHQWPANVIQLTPKDEAQGDVTRAVLAARIRTIVNIRQSNRARA